MMRTKRFVYADVWTARALLDTERACVTRLDYTTRIIWAGDRTSTSVGVCENVRGVIFSTERPKANADHSKIVSLAFANRTPCTPTKKIKNFFDVNVSIDRVPTSWKSDARTARAFRFFFRLYASRRPHLNETQIYDALSNVTESQRTILLRMYVEPYEEQNLLAQLTSVFMHSRQQGGLNAKHASLRPPDIDDDSTSARQNTIEKSIAEFDGKLYIEMSTSCIDRSLCEVVLRITEIARLNLARMTESFRSWRVYDCGEYSLLRIEYERSTGSEYVAHLLDTTATLYYTSDKNIFVTRDDFVQNFLRYYSFYFNYERPPSNELIDTTMELRICVIYFYARVNWNMLHRNKCLGNSNQSISINPQSLYKSNGNPIYAVFSENSIHRVVAQENFASFVSRGPYVGRGIGQVPQLGINAVRFDLHV